MYYRLELHNHTTESDANISYQELLEYMIENKVDGFALTDHNTISGHHKMKSLIEQTQPQIQCNYGMEYTTYYGHILCFNLHQYISWEDINPHHPEKLFERIKATKAICGIAHPYSYGHPFARGCLFEMNMTDYSSVDFIEVFNNLEPLHEVNEKGLLLWEDLVLKGEKLAATCGMDLHGAWDMRGHYATYIEGSHTLHLETDLAKAIKEQKTWISRGVLLITKIIDNEIRFELVDKHKQGYERKLNQDYIITLTTPSQTIHTSLDKRIPLSQIQDSIIIPKLYEQEVMIENLICMSPVMKINKD